MAKEYAGLLRTLGPLASAPPKVMKKLRQAVTGRPIAEAGAMFQGHQLARAHEGAPSPFFPSRQIAVPKAHETRLVCGQVDTYCL